MPINLRSACDGFFRRRELGGSLEGLRTESAEIPHSYAPDSHCIIGYDAERDAYTQHDFLTYPKVA